MSQTEFHAALLDPARPVPGGLTDGAGRPTTKRFAVYRNNVAVSLTEALETGFPVLRKLLGQDFFKAMAGVYLRAHPPSSPLMMHYGAEMPDFLAAFPPVAHLPYLPDVARLELALRESYHAADAPPVDPTTLQVAEPEALVLAFAPATRLVRSDFPVHGIWLANTTGGTPGRGAEAALVTRPGFDPEVHHLSPAQGAVAAALMAGAPLGEAAARAPDADLPGLLTLLVTRGALTTRKDTT